MLTSIRIQNFRSIRDASVKLGQVNLFIGPNNSGKSNFLKGIEIVAHQINHFPNEQVISNEWYKQNISRDIDYTSVYPLEISIELSNQLSEGKFCEVSCNLKPSNGISNNKIINRIDASFINRNNSSKEIFDLSVISPKFPAFPEAFYQVRNLLQNCVIYKLEPAIFEFSAPLSNQPNLVSNGKNIANFLYSLSQNHEELFHRLKRDFTSCINNLVSISIPPDPDVLGNLKIKFFDSQKNSYWADEVSEGVLYFLSLLCVVHQPDPPKLVLLEEPEKGIHPRRIREVLDFIFELARLRGIQIILTSHSPYVVDYFADIPECISIFDRDPETGYTVINNAGEHIEQTNAELTAQNLPPVSYTDSLGEYWVSGFLGGVPLSL